MDTNVDLPSGLKIKNVIEIFNEYILESLGYEDYNDVVLRGNPYQITKEYNKYLTRKEQDQICNLYRFFNYKKGFDYKSMISKFNFELKYSNPNPIFESAIKKIYTVFRKEKWIIDLKKIYEMILIIKRNPSNPLNTLDNEGTFIIMINHYLN